MPPPKTNGPQLFPEIVEDILDYFNPDEQEDCTTLRRCSQVSKHFAVKSQTMLFREIKLIDDEVLRSLHHDNAPASISRRCQRLSKIIDNKPYLAGSIRAVSITLGYTNKWISDDVNFIDLMGRLARPDSGFNSLLLRGTSEDVKIADNRAFERNVLIPFIAPRLISLHIFLLSSVPLALISESPHLVDLSLTYAQPERMSAIPRRTSGNPLPAVQNLRIKQSRLMLPVLASHPSLSHPFAQLSGLAEYTDEMLASWDTSAIQQILVEAKDSLKKLRIMTPSDQGSLQSILNPAIPGFYLNTVRSLNFSQCTRLQYIGISLVFGGRYSSLVANIAASLGSVSAPSTLKEIEMTFHLRADSRQTVAALSSADWPSLRKQIARIAGDESFKFILNFRAGHLPLSIHSPNPESKIVKETIREINNIREQVFQVSAEQPGLLFEVSCLV